MSGGIAVQHVGFALIAGGMILLAWSRWKGLFPPAFFAANLVMMASWLDGPAAVALLLFLLPAYAAARHLWGRRERAEGWVIPVAVAVQTVAFILLRRYLPWPDHPIAIVGLSYMLFRTIHLVIEAPYLGHFPLTAARYFSYVTAFWTLLSGPIQRYDDHCNGLANVGRPADPEALAAAHRAVNGLIKAFVLAPVFLKASDIGLLGGPEANWIDFAIVFYAYPIYLYLNFSGYTDTMIGVARLCGFTTLPENFNRPWLARNVQEFWTRWHMSFGVWIRAYLFTPVMKRLVTLGGSGRENPMMAASVILTFLIVGAWHGTTANFLVFGALHGLGVLTASGWGALLGRRLGKKGRKEFLARPWVRRLATVLCFHYVCATLALVPNDLNGLAAALKAFFAG